jgi:hypothetical protein
MTTEQIEEVSEIEELQEGEYGGEIENNNIITEEIIEKPSIEAKQKDVYYFRSVKKFGNHLNQTLIQEIASNQKYLIQLAELEIDALDDDDLYNTVKPLYPNLTPIVKPLDRELMLKMLYSGSSEYLAQIGLNCFEIWAGMFANFGLVRKNNDEIVGLYGIKHNNKFDCDVIIMLRGGHRQKAKTAKEMVYYWGSTYAKLIKEQGYKYALSVTLTEKHAALVLRVRSEELKLLVKKLKGDNPELTDEAAERLAKKECPGFYSTGTILHRQFEGKMVKEKHWEYSLEAKFGK